MPKVPADNVVRHEIVLGKAERDLARQTLEAYQFNRFATPIVAGLSDVTFTLTVATFAGFAIGKILDTSGIDPNWRTKIGSRHRTLLAVELVLSWGRYSWAGHYSVVRQEQ